MKKSSRIRLGRAPSSITIKLSRYEAWAILNCINEMKWEPKYNAELIKQRRPASIRAHNRICTLLNERL